MKTTHSEFDKINCIEYGFFGRKGGVSSGIFNSLNCGLYSSDNPENIQQNRKIVLSAINSDNLRLFSLDQIHSADVITVTKDSVYSPKDKGDALVTNCSDTVIGVLTADCTPVLFVDDNAKIIGAAHAGWKGSISGVLENTVDKMLALGAAKHNIRAVIGPVIHQKSYEVGPEFYDNLLALDKGNGEFFIKSVKPSHFMFDLPGYATKRLNRHGIDIVANINRDTYSEPENFFSYRRNCHENIKGTGGNFAVIRLK